MYYTCVERSVRVITALCTSHIVLLYMYNNLYLVCFNHVLFLRWVELQRIK